MSSSSVPSPNPLVALVTGSNRGIGLAVAQQLAAHGWVVFTAARQPAAAEAAARSAGGLARPLVLDVSDPASVQAAAQIFGQQATQLDALINNAGVLLDDDSPGITHTAIETLRETFETNTFGPLRVTQAFLPFLEKGTRRRIVNVSSGGGQLSDGMGTWAPAYCISKTALNAVTTQLSAALAPRGYRINSVSPGWVRTAMGGDGAPLSVNEGADSIVWLAAAEEAGEMQGQFIRERKVIAW